MLFNSYYSLSFNITENSLEETTTAKLELVDVKEEPQEVYKEGMIWTPKTDGAPPEGFTIYTTDSGVTLLRRKRQRNLQKLGKSYFFLTIYTPDILK